MKLQGGHIGAPHHPDIENPTGAHQGKEDHTDLHLGKEDPIEHHHQGLEDPTEHHHLEGIIGIHHLGIIIAHHLKDIALLHPNTIRKKDILQEPVVTVVIW